MKRKGFTLIELIVVMAIISILVLLGAPKYKEYVNEARLTKIKVDTSELEKASSTYYMRNNEWPRLSDIPYSKGQIDAFAQEVHDKTGETVVLEDGGNYYDIDYAKLSNYIKKPKEIVNYILQNPVGNVYYLQGLTENGENRVEDIIEPNPVENNLKFSGLTPEVYDKVSNTKHTLVNGDEILLEGNFDNKAINVILTGSTMYNGTDKVIMYFKDVNGNNLKFLNLSGSYTESISVSNESKQFKVIAPEGAVKIIFNINAIGGGSIFDLNDIYLEEEVINPNEVSNIVSVETDTSIELSWNQSDADYSKAAIYRDDNFIGFSTGQTYLDTSLYASQEYNYEIQAIDINGNASRKVSYTTSTSVPDIVFSGMAAEAFDKIATTKVGISTGNTVIWTGDITTKLLNVNLSGFSNYGDKATMYVKDALGNNLSFINVSTSANISSIAIVTGTVNYKLQLPPEAVKLSFVKTAISGGSSFYVTDIYVE